MNIGMAMRAAAVGGFLVLGSGAAALVAAQSRPAPGADEVWDTNERSEGWRRGGEAQRPAARDGGPAQARGKADPEQRARRLFRRFDRNRDGVLDRREIDRLAMARAERRIRRTDRNGDGRISPDELRALGRDRMADRLESGRARRLDRNGDGRLSAAELGALGARRITRGMDLDGDGVINRAEAVEGLSRAGRRGRAERGRGGQRLGSASGVDGGATERAASVV